MTTTRLPCISNDPSKIQLERIAHVYFEHPDLDRFEEFAADFGFVEAYRDDDHILYRGYGLDPYCYVARRPGNSSPFFGGAGWIAQTQADFDKAAGLNGAIVSELSPFPGGGRRVTVKTPSGFFIHVVYGQAERVPAQQAVSAQVESRGPMNGSLSKKRFGERLPRSSHGRRCVDFSANPKSIGEFQRFHPGPAMIHKLGHCGYIVNRWDEEMRWYTDNFNFVPSDVQYEPSNEDMDVISFMHLDLGDRFSDHHSLFLSRAQPDEQSRMHHTSFEVEDFDTQLLGHDWLNSKGYTSVWGVGRHILGSQIFDYWRDPSGFTIEHYADGDLVNVHTGTKRNKAGALAIWGPELPDLFTVDGTTQVAAVVGP